MKLRSAKERKLETKKKLQEDKAKGGASGGGDLMSDLASRLMLRRKGISGSKAAGAQDGEPVSPMDRISAMIPPPPAKSDSESHEDNWDQ